MANIDAAWTKQLPEIRGALPLGGQLMRTDPRGPTPAPIAFVGLYPALTEKKMWTSKGGRCWVPTAVERTSFEGSASAKELREKYLMPLGLSEDEVFLIDLYPYYLANVAVGVKGRSMADNVKSYRLAERKRIAVKRRPGDDAMVRWCRELPGNLERLSWWFDRCDPRLVITLGREAAAFARGFKGQGAARRAQELLYTPAEPSTEFGPTSRRVVHCAHPGLLMRNGKGPWNRVHEAWCCGAGAEEIGRVLGR